MGPRGGGGILADLPRASPCSAQRAGSASLPSSLAWTQPSCPVMWWESLPPSPVYCFILPRYGLSGLKTAIALPFFWPLEKPSRRPFGSHGRRTFPLGSCFGANGKSEPLTPGQRGAGSISVWPPSNGPPSQSEMPGILPSGERTGCAGLLPNTLSS